MGNKESSLPGLRVGYMVTPTICVKFVHNFTQAHRHVMLASV